MPTVPLLRLTSRTKYARYFNVEDSQKSRYPADLYLDIREDTCLTMNAFTRIPGEIQNKDFVDAF